MKVVLCTCPPDEAERLARGLLDAGATCVNTIGPLRSLYKWKGEICDEAESLLVVKAPAERLGALSEALHAIHPYELPEWVVLDVNAEETSPAYLAWVRAGGG